MRQRYSPSPSTLELGCIKNIVFTEREIDILSSILSGKSAATISRYLGISTKTVESHVRNIMLKINCNSKEKVIEFIERSGVFELYYQHYKKLFLHYHFLNFIIKISKLPKKPLTCIIYIEEAGKISNSLHAHLDQFLPKIGIEYKFTQDLIGNDKANSNLIIIKNHQTQSPDGCTEDCISSWENDYDLIFLILKKIVDPPDKLNHLIDEFKNLYNSINPELNSSPKYQIIHKQLSTFKFNKTSLYELVLRIVSIMYILSF
ncbi:MAG: helix-turn-helix transcriptional regulator [Rickettsiaceae bacterium]|nr:helix-turn-helix transcriptional regulator [Rickettsiaceae bacterium]